MTKQIQKTIGVLNTSVLKIQQGYFYSRNYTWTFLEKSGIAKVGLDDLLLRITGEVKFFDLKKSGEIIMSGDCLAEIDYQGKRLKIFSPLSGEILETNPILTKNPEMLNDDPYINGWMYKMKPRCWICDTHSYLVAEEATAWSVRELARFKDFLTTSIEKYAPNPSNIILQDGGELRDHALSELPNEVWQDFQDDFLGFKF